jgi:hypothetical protein
MKTIQQSIQIRVLCTSIALIIITLFSCSQEAFAQQWTTNGNDISNTNSGKVGVGTTTPGEQLSVVVNDASNNGISQILSIGHTTSGTPAAGLGSALHFRAKRASDGLTSSTGFIGGVWENPTTEHGALVFAPTFSGSGYGTERMRITSSGNVGIGTTTPTAATGYTALSLNNSTGALFDFMTNNTLKARLQSDGTTFYFNNLANGPIQIYTNSAERMRIDASGNIGVGTTSPAARLDVSQTAAATALLVQSSASGDGARFDLKSTDTGGITWRMASIGNVTNRVGNFEIQDQGQGTINFTIQKTTGNVGIGTTNPAAKLEVAGNINVTGAGNITTAGTIEGGIIKAKYQDVAEWVPAVHSLPPGTVVTLDPTRSNHVAASSQSYDTRVAGVISAQPGIALGEQGENKVLVATTGRVRIKVNASHPIQVGDLLVTSDIPGVAMKSQPLNFGGVQIHRPGTIVGKALEPLAKGTGEILVLLSLQ